MIEILVSSGWYQYHKCTCGGTLSIKFKHPNKPGSIIKIKPNKNYWEYLVSNMKQKIGTFDDLQSFIITI